MSVFYLFVSVCVLSLYLYSFISLSLSLSMSMSISLFLYSSLYLYFSLSPSISLQDTQIHPPPKKSKDQRNCPALIRGTARSPEQQAQSSTLGSQTSSPYSRSDTCSRPPKRHLSPVVPVVSAYLFHSQTRTHDTLVVALRDRLHCQVIRFALGCAG